MKNIKNIHLFHKFLFTFIILISFSFIDIFVVDAASIWEYPSSALLNNSAPTTDVTGFRILEVSNGFAVKGLNAEGNDNGQFIYSNSNNIPSGNYTFIFTFHFAGIMNNNEVGGNIAIDFVNSNDDYYACDTTFQPVFGYDFQPGNVNPSQGHFYQTFNVVCENVSFSGGNYSLRFFVSQLKDAFVGVYDRVSYISNATNQDIADAITESNKEIIDADISDSDKELPDDSKFNEYEDAESDLMEKMSQADLSNLTIGIDSKSSSWIWNTVTRFLQSNSIVFGMFISILSIGIIKLALGR